MAEEATCARMAKMDKALHVAVKKSLRRLTEKYFLSCFDTPTLGQFQEILLQIYAQFLPALEKTINQEIESIYEETEINKKLVTLEQFLQTAELLAFQKSLPALPTESLVAPCATVNDKLNELKLLEDHRARIVLTELMKTQESLKKEIVQIKSEKKRIVTSLKRKRDATTSLLQQGGLDENASKWKKARTS
eukprot:TRINITY_DN22672_c0_g1_i1.p1 TRINITY_DN22672_c0_g1~~TRINITY_DN22672_c0_g1_i1.p1  ORF type:complete len:192 (-),score=45.59 TRINITY_DN22672_c0_g1_i1:62-637(-)